MKCVGIQLKFLNLPNNEYKTLLQTRCAKKMEKKHACNFMGTMLLQQIAKPMLQTSNELQNKIPTFFFKLSNTKRDPTKLKKNSKPNTHLVQVAYYNNQHLNFF
jgi:hypothetical protein